MIPMGLNRLESQCPVADINAAHLHNQGEHSGAEDPAKTCLGLDNNFFINL